MEEETLSVATLSFATVTLTKYTQLTENTKKDDFVVSNLAQNDREVAQLCAQNGGSSEPATLLVGEDPQVVLNVAPGDSYKFVTFSGGAVSGSHVLNVNSGDVTASYDSFKDVEHLKQYFLEMCVGEDLLYYALTETIKGSNAPAYEGDLQTEVQMLTS